MGRDREERGAAAATGHRFAVKSGERALDLDLLQIIRPDGTLAAGAALPPLSEKDLESIYRHMVRVRTVEGKLHNLQRSGRIRFYGQSLGEEASVIGSAYALEKQDWIFPALRQGGAMLMRGMPMTLYLAEMFGNSLDIQKGRQQPMHFSYPEGNAVAWSSCMSNQLPQAVGAAYAFKIRGERKVAAAYLGDGATSEGDFHTAMNFAATWKTPCVLICQNNQWAISVPGALQTASLTYAVKARAYGMPGLRVDGNDAVAVYAATRQAVDRARAGDGPTFIECVTYRMGAHSSSDDPKRYRPDSEVSRWKELDPIDRMRKYLDSVGLWSDTKERELIASVQDEVDRATKECEAAPPPPVETMFQDVYHDVPPHLEQQYEELVRVKGLAKKSLYRGFP
jgi:pyruvate dehydrogenase E1 component alpha subunit/2-oxoisovalerate dehydrogenase E1 component alpha subunit